MLSTNEKAEVGESAIMLNSATGIKSYLSHGIIQKAEGYNIKCEKQYLYLLSDEDIKENDYCIDIETNKMFQYKYNARSLRATKKIVATTDLKLGLPMIQESFIKSYTESYNKDTIINTVEVEFENALGNEEDENMNLIPELFIKLKNNTISIKSPKNTFSREEVIDLLFKALTADGPGAYNMGWNDEDAMKWINHHI